MARPAEEVAIALERPRQPGVTSLLRELDAYLAALYPAESNHLLDLNALERPEIRFAVARRQGTIVGCGALRRADGFAELKRMYVHPSARGLGIGRRVLAFLETVAREEGIDCLRLETGIDQPEAIGLYRRAGFVERGPFGAYRADPLSLFMEKRLSPRRPEGGH